MKEKNVLVIIDPQNDFCDHRGSLYVEGAFADMKRLTAHIEAECGRYTDIFVSLDSHDAMAIFHPCFWSDGDGNSPAPFTAITQQDFASGRWRAATGENQTHALRTFAAMSEKDAGPMVIWPEHCVVSTWGHQISDVLREALATWRGAAGRAVRYIFKGENPYTDQFSVFEGLDSSYPETAFNEKLFAALADADSLTFAGEALSHCVAESVLSYMGRLGEKEQRVLLLEDCTSPVAGFDCGKALDSLARKGVQLTASA